MKERWVFTQSEIARIGQPDFAPKGYNEFITSVLGQESAVIVYRNGTVSNRWSDGTRGIPAEVVELADAEETYYSEELDEDADCWRDVLTNEDGDFLGLDPTPA